MNSKSHFQLQKRDPWKSFTKRIPPAACKTGVGYTYMYNLLLTDSMHASRISANAQMAGLKSAECPKRQHFCVVAISNQLRPNFKSECKHTFSFWTLTKTARASSGLHV